MNTDKLTTVLGVIQGVGVAVGDYLVHAKETGAIEWTAPTFWIGLAVSVLMALKAYYTNK
jgi:uncharacterized membrane protein